MSIPAIISTLQHALHDPTTSWGKNGDLLRVSLADALVPLTPLGFPVSLVAEDQDIADLVRVILLKDRQQTLRFAARISWRLHQRHGLRGDIANQAVNCYIMAGNLPDARLPVDAGQGPIRRGRPWTFFWIGVATTAAWLGFLGALGAGGWWAWERVVAERVSEAVAILGNSAAPLRDRVADPRVVRVESQPEVLKAREAASAAYAQGVVQTFAGAAAHADPFSPTWEATLAGYERVVADPLLTGAARDALAHAREQELLRRGTRTLERLRTQMPVAGAPVVLWNDHLRDIDRILADGKKFLTPEMVTAIAALRAASAIARADAVVAIARALIPGEGQDPPEALTKARNDLAGLIDDPLLPEDRVRLLKDLAGEVAARRGARIVQRLTAAIPEDKATLADLDRFHAAVRQAAEAKDVPDRHQGELDRLLAATVERRTGLLIQDLLARDPGRDRDPVAQMPFLTSLNEASADRSLTEAGRQRLHGLMSERALWCETRLRAALAAVPAAERVLDEAAWTPLFAAAVAYGAPMIPGDKGVRDFAARLLAFRDKWFVPAPRVLKVRTVTMGKSSRWSPSFSKPDLTFTVMAGGKAWGERVVKSVPDDKTVPVDLLARPVMTWGTVCTVVVDDHDGHKAEFPFTAAAGKGRTEVIRAGGEPGLALELVLDDAGLAVVPAP